MTKFLQHDIFLLLHNAEPRNICLGIRKYLRSPYG